MKNIAILITLVALVFTAQFAQAEEKAEGKGNIAIVDIKMIVDKSSAAKNIASQIEKKREEFQKEVTSEEEGLREEDQDLAKQRNVLSKEAFEEKAKEFRSKVVEAQRLVQSRRTQLENAYVKALAQVQESTLEIIKEMSGEKGFVLALPKSQVLYSGEGLDISEEVLKRLDEKLPKVEVKIEEVKKKE